MSLKCGLYGWGLTRYTGRVKYTIQWVPDDRCYYGDAQDLLDASLTWEAKGLTVDECLLALAGRVR